MTETTTKKDPFDFLFFYEFDTGEREEDALLVGGDDPSTASPLHLAIGIKDAGKIVISPIPDVTRVSSSNYHFKLQFTPGILLQPEQITVEGDDWGVEVEGDTNLYLLWKGEEVTLDDTNSIELMLNGVMGTLAPAVRTSQTNVTLSWEFKRGSITVIDVTPMAPGDSNPFNNTATETLEMIQRQGKANIPLYVGFFSSNRVLNTNNQESNLKLRITNTSESPITFNYDADATNRSQLIVALEVGDAGTVPWALGTADQVNDVEVSIAGGKWNISANPTEVKVGTTVRALEWTISPKSADVPLAPQETVVVELSKIVTAHPTGTANLYLRYKYLPGYQDGEFICPIEKAPLVFPEKNVGIGTTTPKQTLHVAGDYYGKGHMWLHANEGDGRSGTAYIQARDSSGSSTPSTIDLRLRTQENGTLKEVMHLDSSGNVGIGTITPEAQLHVKETIQARKIVADGAVFTGMILMWSGATNNIPTGWKLCDGNNGTPDLRNRFLVGAGDDYPVNNKGGQNQVTLSVGELPKHSHDVDDKGHSHTVNLLSKAGESDNADDRDVMVPGSKEVPTNHVTSNFTILEKGDGKPFDIRPLYYALCFIMKVNI